MAEAVAAGRPVVALESTIISHGMPYPQNVAMATEVEGIVREHGAVPATIAVLGGVPKVGLSPDDLELLASDPSVVKASVRDLPSIIARGGHGATTVAATMRLASLAGIRVFVTGGLGGVHRGAATSFDVSADLTELSTTPVCVVSAGVKSILDIGLTLEKLETLGVPVLVDGSDEFPSFYSRGSGFAAPLRADGPEEIARAMDAAWSLVGAGAHQRPRRRAPDPRRRRDPRLGDGPGDRAGPRRPRRAGHRRAGRDAVPPRPDRRAHRRPQPHRQHRAGPRERAGRRRDRGALRRPHQRKERHADDPTHPRRRPHRLAHRPRLHGHQPELRSVRPTSAMVAFLREAVDHGVTLFDTAEVYGPFENEEIVGEALEPVRDQVVIATKFGFAFDENGQSTGVSSRPETIRAAVDGSLRRLRTDVIDLLYQHRVDPDVPIEDVAGTVKELIARRQGPPLRHVRGRPDHHPARTRGPARHRAAERVLLVLARAGGVGARHHRGARHRLRPFSPLGRGLLTGQVTRDSTFGEGDIRATLPRFSPEALASNLDLVDRVTAVADRLGVTPGQVALAWLLAQKPWIVPIPGTRRIERVDENLAAADLDLAPDVVAELTAASDSVTVQGDRYPEHMQAMVDRS